MFLIWFFFSLFFSHFALLAVFNLIVFFFQIFVRAKNSQGERVRMFFPFFVLGLDTQENDSLTDLDICHPPFSKFTPPFRHSVASLRPNANYTPPRRLAHIPLSLPLTLLAFLRFYYILPNSTLFSSSCGPQTTLISSPFSLISRFSSTPARQAFSLRFTQLPQTTHFWISKHTFFISYIRSE
jgi:hypothetical protein